MKFENIKKNNETTFNNDYTKLMDYYNHFEEWNIYKRYGTYGTCEKLVAAACENKDKEGIEFFLKCYIENYPNKDYWKDKRLEWVCYFVYVLWHSQYSSKEKTPLSFAAKAIHN